MQTDTDYTYPCALELRIRQFIDEQRFGFHVGLCRKSRSLFCVDVPWITGELFHLYLTTKVQFIRT